jgi:hypothetical protein
MFVAGDDDDLVESGLVCRDDRPFQECHTPDPHQRFRTHLGLEA